MTELAGTPSDDVPEILAAGRSSITSTFVGMSARHPEGADADYLHWHCLDHRPEQYRLASIRASSRLVSTPACRAARAACDERYAGVDHVTIYFLADLAVLEEGRELSAALTAAGRIPPSTLPLVERGVYGVDGGAAAPRIKVGADVLPWWPAQGVYLLVERGEAPGSELGGVPGVGGAWWGGALTVDEFYSTAEAGTWITYCFLDDDPVATAERLRPALEARWTRTGVEPLLAAPFHVVDCRDWARHLP